MEQKTYCVSVMVKVDAKTARNAETLVMDLLNQVGGSSRGVIKSTDVTDVEVCHEQDED